jgi:predicted DNA-binding transcriptional regulator AlpA
MHRMIALEAAMTSAIDEEWWTTEMVCAHLKLSKRALWDLRAHPTKAFPVAIKPGGKINLFRAAEVRAWMAAGARPGGALPKLVPTQTTEPAVAHADQPAAAETSSSAPAVAKRQSRSASRSIKDARQLDLF